MTDFGGMLTFQLTGGLGAAITLAEKIRVFEYATSLGHAHSLLFYYPTDMYVDAAPTRTPARRHASGSGWATALCACQRGAGECGRSYRDR